MRLKFFLIVFCLACSSTSFAQSQESEAQKPAPAVHRTVSPQQEAELVEAQRLGLEVIKLYNRQKYDEALPMATKAAEITERILGAEDQQLATAFRNLAELYAAKRKYKQAEQFFVRAIMIDDLTPSGGSNSEISTLDRYLCFLYETRSIGDGLKAESEFYNKRRKLVAPQSVEDLKGGSLAGGVLNGRALSLPVPGYPPEAKRLGAIGIVRVRVLIDETGKVVEARVLCGHPIFAKPSLESAYKARFTPTKLSGMAVKVNGLIVYNFQY